MAYFKALFCFPPQKPQSGHTTNPAEIGTWYLRNTSHLPDTSLGATRLRPITLGVTGT